MRLRMSSAYHAQSNGRAEVAVKTVKRALRDNVGDDGKLDRDTFARALLLLRNTPDRDTGVSPAELLFGRRLQKQAPPSFARLDGAAGHGEREGACSYDSSKQVQETLATVLAVQFWLLT